MSILSYLSYSVMQSDGNSWKIDTFWEAITSELWTLLNSENFYSSIFVSRKCFYLFRTCLNVWFINGWLLKSVRFQTVPIWLHHTVEKEKNMLFVHKWPAGRGGRGKLCCLSLEKGPSHINYLIIIKAFPHWILVILIFLTF